jgi:monofunctional biosynthetic peptidoglycan transglycosylase
LNTSELGPGVFGVEAAALYHYKTHALNLDREQCARLAAILPSPRRRRPAAMNNYSAIIQERMTLLGW